MERLVEVRERDEDFVDFPQESFGADIVESCTDLALDRFFEAKNAFMAPLLNAPGIVMLYSDDAEITLELPVEPGMERRKFVGSAEIQVLFEELAEIMISITAIEGARKVTGRKAFWSGIIRGVHRARREPVKLDALFRLEFDEHDLVIRQWSRLTPAAPDEAPEATEA